MHVANCDDKRRDEMACKSVVGSTPAAVFASAQAEGALIAAERRRRAALSQTVMCLPAVEPMGAAMPAPLPYGRLTTYDSTKSFEQPVALSAALPRFRANISGRSPAKTCICTWPRFLQCNWCSFASSEIFDQKGGSLSQNARIPVASIQNTSSISGATSSRSLTNERSVFSTLEMMACLQGAKNGGYLDDARHSAGSLELVTTMSQQQGCSPAEEEECNCPHLAKVRIRRANAKLKSSSCGRKPNTWWQYVTVQMPDGFMGLRQCNLYWKKGRGLPNKSPSPCRRRHSAKGQTLHASEAAKSQPKSFTPGLRTELDLIQKMLPVRSREPSVFTVSFASEPHHVRHDLEHAIS